MDSNLYFVGISALLACAVLSWQAVFGKQKMFARAALFFLLSGVIAILYGIENGGKGFTFAQVLLGIGLVMAIIMEVSKGFWIARKSRSGDKSGT